MADVGNVEMLDTFEPFAETLRLDDNKLLSLDNIDGVQTNTPPVVSNPLPTPMSTVGVDQALSYDLTDLEENSILNVVAVLLTDGSYEVVHDGTAFSTGYQALSTRTAIANGWRYSIRRSGGWPVGSVRVRHWSVDNQGAQNGA